MANVIKHKRGSGSDPVASDLVVGEVAIRTDVGKLFTKMDNGSVAEIAGGGSDIIINTLSSSSGTGGGSATFNGSAYRFTLSQPPSVSAQQLLVSINGVIQKPVAGTGQPSEGFSVDGNDIILGDAPATGSDFFILTFKSLGVSEPADNSVTSAKIVDGAIVNADINASAAIAGSKISPDFGSQNITTTGDLSCNDITLSGGNPEIFFTDNDANPDYRLHLNNGLFQIHDQTNNVTRLQINTDGHIDVGHLDVGSGLDVTGTITATGNLNCGDIVLTDQSPSITFTDSDNNPDYALITNAGIFKIHDSTNAVTRLLIDSSGNIGIGKTPSRTLDVAGKIRSSDSVCFGDNSSTPSEGAAIHRPAASTLGFVTNDSERMRIDSIGNMGLGVTPNANWPSNGDSRALQIGSGACVFGRGSGDEDRGGIAVNYYSDGSGNKYLANGNAARIYLNDGNIDFDNASSNSSGANASMTLNTRMRINSSGNIGIGINNQNNKLEIGTASHYVVTNSGQARNGLHIRGQGGNSGEFGGAISFGCNNTGAAAIAAEQMSSDSDVVGLSFFTHESSTGTDDAKKRVKITQNGGIILNNYEATRGYIFQRLGTGTYPDFPNVQGSSGRGMCDGQRVVSANTATEIAKSHWGGLAIVGYSNSQHQGTAQVMFGYGSAGASVKFEGHWVRQESLTITFSMYLYSLQITHNASNDLSVWCVLIGV